eukprot:m.46168 g.46168  ORF g.46168 m.46168 type:complete len:479 (-) comp10714_c0_seq1:188-1624(-)
MLKLIGACVGAGVVGGGIGLLYQTSPSSSSVRSSVVHCEEEKKNKSDCGNDCGRDLKSIQQQQNQTCFDVGIVGGGIVGVACARELKIRYPNKRIALFEKDNDVGNQQSGNNSGVIHCGIYYGKGSLRAKLCTKGNKEMYKYCVENDIPHKRCGKLIVAVEERELEPLRKLYENGLGNNVEELTWLEGTKAIQTYEPNCVGLAAIHCNTTGIVDYRTVTKVMRNDFEDLGGVVFTNTKVIGFEDSQTKGSKVFVNGVRIQTNNGPSFVCDHVVTCGGAYSDKLAQMTGCRDTPKIIPVRGEYLKLKKGKESLVRGNIYPVPDSRVPFLGVHFTPRTNGDVLLGPNAVLAFAREGYSYSDINWKELLECVSYVGFVRLATKYWDFGAHELWRSLNTAAQVRRLQKYVPTLELEDVEEGPAGVRAMALGEDGEMVKDFLFDSGDSNGRILHVRNAPSPAATSSIAIAKYIADYAKGLFKL